MLLIKFQEYFEKMYSCSGAFTMIKLNEIASFKILGDIHRKLKQIITRYCSFIQIIFFFQVQIRF